MRIYQTPHPPRCLSIHCYSYSSSYSLSTTPYDMGHTPYPPLLQHPCHHPCHHYNSALRTSSIWHDHPHHPHLYVDSLSLSTCLVHSDNKALLVTCDVTLMRSIESRVSVNQSVSNARCSTHTHTHTHTRVCACCH